MKKAFFIGWFLFVLLFGHSAFAQAQFVPRSAEGWYYYLRGDQIAMLQADTVDMLYRQGRIGRHQPLRRLAENLFWNGGQWGLRGQGENFHPIMDSDGNFLSRRQRIERAAGITGLATGGGYAVGGRRGAGIGALIGGAIAAINDSRYRSSDDDVREGTQQLVPAAGSLGSSSPSREYRHFGGTNPDPESPNKPITHVYKFRNEYEEAVDIFANERRILSLFPGQEGIFKTKKPINRFGAKSIKPVNMGDDEKYNPFDLSTEFFSLGIERDSDGVFVIYEVTATTATGGR